MKNIIKYILLPIFLCGIFSSVSLAEVVRIDFDIVFSDGSTHPKLDTPWLSVIIDDHDAVGSVTMTFQTNTGVDTGLSDPETLAGVYLNLDSDISTDSLEFNYITDGSTGPKANQIHVGIDAYKADGDGYYDLLFDFPPPPGNNKFNAGETVVYQITGEGLVADSFVYWSNSEGSEWGPYIAAAKILSTGDNGSGSAWIASEMSAVPVPAGILMFLPSIVGIAAIGRRRN